MGAITFQLASPPSGLIPRSDPTQFPPPLAARDDWYSDPTSRSAIRERAVRGNASRFDMLDFLVASGAVIGGLAGGLGVGYLSYKGTRSAPLVLMFGLLGVAGGAILGVLAVRGADDVVSTMFQR